MLKTTGGTHGGKATATNTVQPHRLSQPIRSLIWCTAMIPLAVLNANAQQVDPLQQLQQQLEQLKQQYADTAKVFEQRIAALEEQLEKQKEASAKAKRGDGLGGGTGRGSSQEASLRRARPERSTKVNCPRSRPMTTCRRRTRKSRAFSKRPPI